jgi:hypothetical protein
MAKIDIKKQKSSLYSPGSKEIQIVDVPKMNFLMIDGVGDPNQALYQKAVEALFSISYTLKFIVKKEMGIDYGVMPLEGLWWAKDMSDFINMRKDNWLWTALIMQPEYITENIFNLAIDKIKKGRDLPDLGKMRFEPFNEGKSVQVLYIGPYSQEGPTIQKIHGIVAMQGYKLRGKHHEIYLSDPRRSLPEKLKTILRQPIEKD